MRYHSIKDVVRGTDASWSEEVGQIIDAINRRGSFYMFLGYGVYGLGSVVILILMRNVPTLATAVVMFFFQLCIIYFGTKVIYSNIGIATWVGIAANRDSVPSFKKLAEQDLQKTLEKASLDFREAGGTIRDEIVKLREALTKPIAPPPRKIVPVVVPVGAVKDDRPPEDNGS